MQMGNWGKESMREKWEKEMRGGREKWEIERELLKLNNYVKLWILKFLGKKMKFH